MALKPRLWTAGLCWLLCAVPAPAQHWSFQMYGPDAGLTNSNILAIHQDRQGFLWIGTEGGLFRYDGDRFQLFGAANVNSIHSSPDGQLWTASSAGLCRFAGNRLVPVPGLAHVELGSGQAMASDAANLYVATPSGLRSLPLRGGGPVRLLSPKAASAVLVAFDGAVWFGCGVRLCSVQDGLPREWPLAAAGPWQSMVEDAAGCLWIRSSDKVLVRLSPRSPFQVVPGLGKLNSTRGSLLGTGPLGEVLIPHAAGLTICQGLDCRTYGAESGLRRAEVYAAAEDREGSLWLGYSGQGLARWLGRNRWQSFAEQEGLSELGIWRIVRDAAGDMWIGTNRGLFHRALTAGRWRFERSDAVGELTVYGLAAEPDGSLWVGTFQTETNGLVRYHPRTRRKWVYPPPKTGVKLSINDISRDQTGAIWVGTANGVMRLAPGAGRLEPVPLPLDGASVFEVRSSPGSLLVAGKKGLYIQQGAVHRLLTVADGLKDNAVQSVAIGPDGAIWAAYFSPLGITRIDLDAAHLKMRHFTVADGLPDDTVYFQFFDAGGRHWLGSGNGVAVSQGDRWIAYDTSDGLVWNDCNAHSYRAEPDGAVWIGTSGGLARFFPLASPTVPPATPLITSAWRNDLPATGPDFNSSTHTIAFRFTILSYAKETTRFRYRLGTGDRPWVETRAHEARFAELPPKSYRFEVEAETAPGTWGQPAAFQFRILPHWFLSWPFQTGLLLSLAALVWLWWRQREVRQRTVRAILEATVRERTRDLTKATERAEQANRVKGEFLANMSHEMRTPLNGVIGLTELALDLSTQPEVLHHLRIAQLSAKSLLSLINDVLDFSKIEAGRLEVDPAVFEVRPFVAEVHAILEPEASRKALSLQATVDDSVPGWVLADNRRLRQVLLNLVGNAIKFTEAGTVSVRVRRVENQLWFAVADTGIGIPADKQAVIFDAFRQADNSTSRRHGGTGLGLTISRRLVELMGGSLSLESQLGRGTTFSFSIDAPQAAAPVPTGNPRAEVPVRPLRILVAEDHKVNQHLILALLRRLGHIPTLAATGLEALEALARDKFDLVLMDIQMPEMDGLEAVGRIRQAERTSGEHILVVAVTARTGDGDRESMLEAGMDDYLLKPIQTERLAAVLEKALTVRRLPTAAFGCRIDAGRIAIPSL